MPKQMLSFSDITWDGIVDPGDDPIRLCMRNGLSIYFRLDKDHQLVRYFYWLRRLRLHDLAYEQVNKFSLLGPDWKAPHQILQMECIVEALHDEILFLRLDNSSLAEIVVSGRSTVSSFSSDGFSIPRPFTITGHGPRGHAIRKYDDIKVPVLEAVNFERAFLIDKKKWESASSVGLRNDYLPEVPAISVKVGINDLWFDSDDIDALGEGKAKGRELVSYPFDHKGQMPGLYWIYQASYALSRQRLPDDDGKILDWLRTECGINHDKEAFAGKRGLLALKLVHKEWNRSKGRKKGPRPFKIADLKNWADVPDKYDISFIGEGLTLVLAVADWWVDRIEEDSKISRVRLALKLYAQNFDETEAGHIVRLIAGVQLSKGERGEFEKLRIEMDKRKG